MTTLSIVGTTVCNAAFDTGYIFSKELFPTILRTSALSTASAFARIGSLLTPLVATLEYYDPMLPVACYGIFVLIAGIQVCRVGKIYSPLSIILLNRRNVDIFPYCKKKCKYLPT